MTEEEKSLKDKFKAFFKDTKPATFFRDKTLAQIAVEHYLTKFDRKVKELRNKGAEWRYSDIQELRKVIKAESD